MKTLIAPTDFSAASLNAVNYAADLAVAINAELLLVNIVPLPISVIEVPITQATFDEMEEDVDKELANLKEQLLVRTNNKVAINIYSAIGNIEYDLEEITNKRHPFAVIMSTKGASAFERFFAGSNTLNAIRHIQFPVLIIPETVSYKKIAHVALAFDLEDNINRNTIKTIKDWITLSNASLDVINVTAKADISSNALAGSVTVRNYFSELDPKFHFVNFEKVADGINDYINNNHPDLLIVVPKNRGFIYTIFHKSHSKNFILHPHVPVLAIMEEI